MESEYTLKANAQEAQYWRTEEPQVFFTQKNVFRFYPKANRLVVHLPDYKTDKGIYRPGKAVGIKLQSLRESPDVLLKLISILTDLSRS